MPRMLIGRDERKRGIYLELKERSNHMHIIGATGTGKSKLMEWMIREDIRNGQGLCLIDPHGTLYEDILRWCAFHRPRREIILLDPSSGDYVVGFNPFRKTGDDISVQVDYMITATIRAWDMEDTDEMPTLERMLRCIYQTLIEKELPITAVEYLINYFDQNIREHLTADLSQPLIRKEWEALGKRSLKQFEEEILSTKNRLMRFLCSDQICRFMGLRQSIDVREIMDEGKILLVNLAESEHLSSYNARLFGTLLINEFCQQAKRRKKDRYGRPPKPFFLYIDEFQNFVTIDIASGLDQLRKFGLYFVLAHQRFGQVGGRRSDIVDAVLHNAKVKIVFGGLSRDEAKRMVQEIFVGQIDLKEVKHEIKQTKFWPKYRRDKIYNVTFGSSYGSSTSKGFSEGHASHKVPPSDGWLFSGWFDKEVSFTDSEVEISGRGEFESNTVIEGETDIPIFFPEPFKEVTSAEFWSLEEQIWRLSEELKGLPPRQCFIHIPGRRTQRMIVPYVKSFYVSEERVQRYKQLLYERCGALRREEADRIIRMEKERIREEAEAYDGVDPESFREPK